MYTQNYHALGALWLSAAVAFLPIIIFILGFTVLKLKGTTTALLALFSAVLIALLEFHMPLEMIYASVGLGILNGIWPLVWITTMALWFYRLTVKGGNFKLIRTTITEISEDQRVQVLLIAFALCALLEGIAGFGVPIAICSVMLMNLGFKPIKAACLCLIADIAFGPYGDIGIPITTAAKTLNVDTSEMTNWIIVLFQVIIVLTPFLLMWILDGRKGITQMLPLLIPLTLVFNGTQILLLWLSGPELANIIPALLSMVLIAVWMKKWQPRSIFREDSQAAPEKHSYTYRELIRAWAPFTLLAVIILFWNSAIFKNLFTAGPLHHLAPTFTLDALDHKVFTGADLSAAPLTAQWTFTPFNSAGTAIFVTILIFFTAKREMSARVALHELVETVKELKQAIIIIVCVLALASVSSYSGATATMALAFAQSGHLFPFFSPAIGWLGVFTTGSVTNSNNLFVSLQAITAHQTGLNPALTAAANTVGGSIAKAVTPESIEIAIAAMMLSKGENAILMTTIRYSALFLLFSCVLCYLVATA